jgi:hypothetical protein
LSADKALSGLSDTHRPSPHKNQIKIIGQAASRGPPEGKAIMISDSERRLVARAEELDDTSELAETVTAILGGGRAAGLDPDALSGLTGAALALGADSLTVYAAGTRRGRADRFGDEGAFITAVSDAEDDIDEQLRAVAHLRTEVSAAVAAAEAALAAAYAMPSRTPDEAAARQAAITAATERVGNCEYVLDVLDVLTARLCRALARIRAVPEDVGEVYESVYRLLRRGGLMPHEGGWLTGQARAS